MKELIKTFRKYGCTLRLWDLNSRDYLGKWKLGYELKSGRKVIFKGDDFACSPLHGVDSLETVAAILGFLTCKPGDTDAEYFANYTQEQLDWCHSYQANYLSMWVYDRENKR